MYHLLHKVDMQSRHHFFVLIYPRGPWGWFCACFHFCILLFLFLTGNTSAFPAVNSADWWGFNPELGHSSESTSFSSMLLLWLSSWDYCEPDSCSQDSSAATITATIWPFHEAFQIKKSSPTYHIYIFSWQL